MGTTSGYLRTHARPTLPSLQSGEVFLRFHQVLLVCLLYTCTRKRRRRRIASYTAKQLSQVHVHQLDPCYLEADWLPFHNRATTDAHTEELAARRRTQLLFASRLPFPARAFECRGAQETKCSVQGVYSRHGGNLSLGPCPEPIRDGT